MLPTLTPSEKERIIQCLSELANIHGAFSYGLGICWYVRTNASLTSEKNELVQALLQEAFTTHPLYSGDLTYPVPSHTPELTAEGCFKYIDNIWAGEYGAMRRDFARHAAEYIRRQYLDTPNQEVIFTL